jgi:hypothetical protein
MNPHAKKIKYTDMIKNQQLTGFSEKTKMATLKDEAMAYEPKLQTKNIADLDNFPVGIEVKTETGNDGEGKPYSYKYVEIEGVKYRIPGVVLGDLKNILKKMSNATHFTVIKSGEGKTTKYQTLPFNPVQQG